jgi:arylsulfatase A-like enzyme
MIGVTKTVPNSWALRCAWALAFFELGLSGFSPLGSSSLGSLGSLPLQILFFIGAFGVYGFGGLIYDAVSQRFGLNHKLFTALPLLAFCYMAFTSASNMLGNLNSFASIAFAVCGFLLALSLLFSSRARRIKSTSITKQAAVLSIVSFALIIYYLMIPRNVTYRQPIADSDAIGPNVVIITWDTIRADVLPLYGGTGLETPVLDALASRSTVFDNMSAVAHITGPSHASILTGVVPPSHGLRSNGTSKISDDIPTAAEIFSAAGYATGGFISAYPVRGDIGFDRGFDVFDDRLPNDRANSLMSIGTQAFTWVRQFKEARRFIEEPSLDGDTLLSRTAEFLDNSQGPFFMWTHFFDAHGKHRPAPAYREKALSLSEGAWPPAVQPEAVGDKMTMYRGEIMELDRMLEEQIAQLEEKDPGLKNTVIFLLSDHGQCFGENGYVISHTPSLTQATQHIPGIIYVPGATTQRAEFAVNQIDVLPTLCALAGLEINSHIQGADLSPIIKDGATSVERDLFKDGFYMEAFQLYLMGGEVQDLIQERKGSISTRKNNQGSKSAWKSREDMRKQGYLGVKWKYVNILNDTEFFYDLKTVDANGQADAEDVQELFPKEFINQRLLFYKMFERIPHAEESALIGSEYDNSMLEQLGYTGGKAQ